MFIASVTSMSHSYFFNGASALVLIYYLRILVLKTTKTVMMWLIEGSTYHSQTLIFRQFEMREMSGPYSCPTLSTFLPLQPKKLALRQKFMVISFILLRGVFMRFKVIFLILLYAIPLGSTFFGKWNFCVLVWAVLLM